MPLVRRPISSSWARAASDERVDAADRHLAAAPAATAPSSSPIIGTARSRRAQQVDEPEADHRPSSRAAEPPCDDLALLARGDCRRRPSAPAAPAPRARRRRRRRRSCGGPRRPARRRWRRGSPRAGPRPRESTVASAPSRSTNARFSSLEARPITFAPARLASCTERRAGAAGGGLDHDRLARLDPRAALDQRHRGQPLQQQRRGLLVVDLVGDRDQAAPRGRPPSRRSRRSASIAATPPPVRRSARSPRPRESAAAACSAR